MRSVVGGSRRSAGPGARRACTVNSVTTFDRSPSPGVMRGAVAWGGTGGWVGWVCWVGWGGPGKVRTTWAGEAALRKNEAGPAQRQAAHSASSTTMAGGPQPDHCVNGVGVTPAGGVTLSSVTHPPTRRPCRTARTRVPTMTVSVQRSGTA